ncbi:ubiquinol-cytochrome c reductase core subunit 1 [Gaertneriomyces sp. JEL0708]|nr:ubiquinol-cytochrome c reductase core subunit 1 [Gaertneriomyces sp. JEL0708]
MLSTRTSSRLLRVAQQTRQYAVLTPSHSSLGYSRKGDQPAVAPKVQRQVSKTSQGITVATVDDLGPVGTVAVVLKAGPRFESTDAPGAAGFWKRVIVRNVPGDNITRTVRETELRGDTLYTALNREELIVASDFLRDNAVDAVPTLLEQVFNKHMYPYEFLHTRSAVVEEAAAATAEPTTKVLDALHQAAFHTGLGNPLFPSAPATKALKQSDLFEFAKKNFTADRIAVVGCGISHEDLTSLVEETLAKVSVDKAAATSTAPAAAKFQGGELRFDAGPKGESHFAIAFPSVSFTDASYPAALVLRALLDGSRRLKWGSLSGSAGLLASAATSKTSATAFDAAYSDAGLLGIYLKGDAGEIKTAAQKAVSALKGVADKGISEEALKRARSIAIVDAEESLTRDVKVAEVAKRVLSGADIKAEVAEAIKKVSVADIQKLAKQATSAKPAVVAYGNLLKLPYSHQL